jgi:hypothetical protein
MSERLKCPSCGVGLILPESAQGLSATCPRCLAQISVPATGREPDAIQAERPERHEEPLRGQERGRYGPPDVDVRRDTKGTSCLVVALAVIGGLGLGWTGLCVQNYATTGYYPPLLFLAVSLLFLAGISTLIVFVRSGGNPGASGFRRVAVGTLALAGAIILGILAVGVCFFVVCAAVYFGR